MGGVDTATGPSGTSLGGTLRTNGQQLDVGSVTLVGDSSVETNNLAAGADITTGTVDGALDLMVDSGTADVTVGGDVGSTMPLASLIVSGTNVTLQDVGHPSVDGSLGVRVAGLGSRSSGQDSGLRA